MLDFGATVCDTQQRSSNQWVTSFLHPNLRMKFQLSAASGCRPPDRTGKKLLLPTGALPLRCKKCLRYAHPSPNQSFTSFLPPNLKIKFHPSAAPGCGPPDHSKKKLRPEWRWLPSRRIPSVEPLARKTAARRPPPRFLNNSLENSLSNVRSMVYVLFPPNSQIKFQLSFLVSLPLPLQPLERFAQGLWLRKQISIEISLGIEPPAHIGHVEGPRTQTRNHLFPVQGGGNRCPR